MELQSEPELRTGCCNPASKSHRFLALFFMCLLGFGSYFVADIQSALQEVFQRELELCATHFTLLYSISSWPNIVLSLVGGYLMDRVFGIRLGSIIFSSLVLLGHLIFATGGLLGSFWLMMVGLFIYGVGSNSLSVAEKSYAVVWFMGKELNMVFGLQMTVGRLSSSLTFWVMEPLCNYVSKFYHSNEALGLVLFIAAGTCIVSFLSALILGYMDKRAESILKRNNTPREETASLSDFIKFKLDFWMVSASGVTFYVAIYPFIAIGQDFFMKHFEMTADEANTVISMIYLVSGITMPFIGFVIDKVRHNSTWMFVATVSTLVSQMILTFTHWNPYIGVTLMGLSFSLMATSMWPMISMIVPEYQLGTAYGCCQSVQSLGLSVVPMLTGVIVDNNNGSHFWVQILFMAFLLISLVPTSILWARNRKSQGNLNKSRGSHHSDKITYLK